MLKVKLPGVTRERPAPLDSKAVVGLHDLAGPRYRRVAEGVSGTSQQARDTMVRQAGLAADAAQVVFNTAKEQAALRAAEVAQNVARLREDAAPVLGGLAGQTRGYAVQMGGQAKGRVGPQASAVMQTVVRQRDDLAPRMAGWTEQARERLAGLSNQAREEIAPAVTEFVGQARERAEQFAGQAKEQLGPTAMEFGTQTRERAEQLVGQVKEQLGPTAADFGAQARDRLAQIGSQGRDTATSLQAAAGGVVPAVTDAATETAAVLGDAMDATGRAVRSTVSNLVWLTVLTGIAVFLYAPKDEERAKLLTEVQEWFAYVVDIVMELRGGE